VDPSIDDFFFADVWDKISLYLDAGNDIMQYIWAVNVLQKIIDTRWSVNVTVSTTTVRALWFFDTIKENERQIKKLQNI
jgi:hypothetical protein